MYFFSPVRQKIPTVKTRIFMETAKIVEYAVTSGFSGKRARTIGRPKKPTLPMTDAMVSILYLLSENLVLNIKKKIRINKSCIKKVITKKMPILIKPLGVYLMDINAEISIKGVPT